MATFHAVTFLLLYVLYEVTNGIIKCEGENDAGDLGGGEWRLPHTECYGSCVSVSKSGGQWTMTPAQRTTSCGTNRNAHANLQSGAGCMWVPGTNKRLRAYCTAVMIPIPYLPIATGQSSTSQRTAAACNNEPCDNRAGYLSHIGGGTGATTALTTMVQTPDYCKMENNADEQDVTTVHQCPPGTAEVAILGCIFIDNTKRTQERACQVSVLVDSVVYIPSTGTRTEKWRVAYHANGFANAFGQTRPASYQYTEYEGDGSNPQHTAHQSYNDMLLKYYEDINVLEDEQETEENKLQQLYDEMSILRKHGYRHKHK